MNHVLNQASKLTLLLALAVASSAQAVHEVPGDFPSIQEAIDAATPGDIVLINGGTHEGPITIDRPLTLMGEPRPSISPPFLVSDFFQPPAIVLAGTGSGRVVLVNLSVGGTVNGITTAQSSPGIEGGGFAELHLVECQVDGPLWVILTGQAFGSPALRTNVPRILLERSSLRGADSANDGCYGNGPPGPIGIDAPASSVVVLDSLVRGGGSRVVFEPRKVLAEFGTELPPEMAISVVDSNADMRYIVLPRRPAGTEHLNEDALAALVTRDSMIGVSLPLRP